MGPYRLLANFLFILILFTTPSSSDSQDWCPSDCTCFTLTGRRLQNHAKCTSINGLLESKNLQIHSLDLSHANLTKINHLDKLRYLSTINLSHNKLSDIGSLGLRVKSIDLSHNKITSAKLVNIPRHVEDLDLSYNEITYLPLEVSKIHLRRLELFGNKINCTCDTLEVRNWVSDNSVVTSQPIKCTYPIELKGKLWLSIKQADYCKKEIEKDEGSIDNDLMLGDAPAINDSEEKNKDEADEELEKGYMRINTNTDDVIDENVEGSGFIDHLPMQNDHDENNDTSSHNETNTNETDQTDDYNEEVEGSGSGMGIVATPNDNETESNSTETPKVDDDIISFVENDTTESEESSPIPIPVNDSTENDTLIVMDPRFGGLGIFQPKDHEEHEISTENPHGDDENEATEVPVAVNENDIEKENDAENVEGAVPGETESRKDDMVVENDINKAEASESNGTYILLATIVIILICLMMYVGLKRMVLRRRQRERDAERAAEMVEMDKNKNLGKPINKNGDQKQPLITNEKPTTNGSGPKKPYSDKDEKTQEPLLNGHHKDPNNDESNNNLTKTPDSEQKIPVPEPRQSLQQQQPNSPRIHSPRYGVYPPKSPKSPDHTDHGGSSPSSPKTGGRYSPVYSPETGKVKIKLSEVPRPKTPMLVTRSRSNAGEFITTPTSDVVDNGNVRNEIAPHTTNQEN